MAENRGEPGNIDVTSIVSGANGQPFVQFAVTQTKWQMTPSEARVWAQVILEAAESADQDAFMFRWLQKALGAKPNQAYALLAEFRESRKQEPGLPPNTASSARPND